VEDMVVGGGRGWREVMVEEYVRRPLELL